MNKIEYSTEAKTKLKKGVDTLANAVKVTLGPKGRNVILNDGIHHPVITKDGVSVAREVFLEDPIENLGAQLLKQVALNTNKEVGDGTTTATVLAQAILEEGFKAIEKGLDPITLQRELNHYMNLISMELKNIAKPIETEKEIYQVANISTNGDDKLSELITEAFIKVGDNILFEESKTSKTYLEIVNGMKFNSSYLSTYFVNSEDQSILYEDGLLFILDGKIENTKQILPVLDQAAKQNKPLIIIAEDVDDNTIINLVSNTKKGNLKSAVIKSPGFGFGRKQSLKDISIYTGAKIYSQKEKLNNIQFGKFDSIVIDSDKTIITGSYGDSDEIKSRIDELNNLMEKKHTPLEIMKLSERISKFKNGIGVIYIGANSQVEMKERKDRLEDAINAVKASREGIVPGGGYTLKYIAKTLFEKKKLFKKPNVKNILYEVLQTPYHQIDINTGDVRIWKDQQFENYMSSGIIDPVKVTRVALENAISVVGTILTTECVINNE